MSAWFSAIYLADLSYFNYIPDTLNTGSWKC